MQQSEVVAAVQNLAAQLEFVGYALRKLSKQGPEYGVYWDMVGYSFQKSAKQALEVAQRLDAVGNPDCGKV